jgi:hypothetical protein
VLKLKNKGKKIKIIEEDSEEMSETDRVINGEISEEEIKDDSDPNYKKHKSF